MADLNALIAQGAQFKAPPDPFAQYAKMQQLEQGETTNQLNRMKMDDYQRDFQQKNKLYTSLQNPDFKLDSTNAIGYGKPGMDVYKFQQEAANTQTEGQIKNTKLLADKLALLPNAYKMADTPEAYVDLHRSVHADPVLGPWLKSTGATQEKGYAQIQNAIQTGKFDELRMKSMQSVDQLLDSMKPVKGSNVAQLIAERNALPPGDPRHLIYNNAITKESQFAPRAITQVNLPGNENKYSETVGAGSGKQDLDAFERSQAIPNDFEKIDETLNALRNTDINTGLGADLFTILDRVRTQVASDKKAKIRTINTEYLDSLLGSAVFPQIQALGIGARGMDTPAERDFLRKVMTGSINLNKDTLIKMTELRRKGLESEANLFNKQVKEGVFAPFEKAARRKVSAIAIPETLQSGADRIPTAGGASKPAAGGGFKYLGKESN